MVTESGSSKRPVCPICSKPAQICLCARLKTPCLENSTGVTILQHSIEKRHHLNSTRIASIGLKNVSVIPVSDVNFQARFLVNFLYPDHKPGSGHLNANSSNFGFIGNGKRKWDSVNGSNLCCGLEESSDFGKFLESPEERRTSFADSDEVSKRSDFGNVTESDFCKDDVDILQKKSDLLLKNNGLNSNLSVKLGDQDVVQGSLERDCAEDMYKCRTSGEAISNSKNKAFIANNLPGLGFSPNTAVSLLSEDAIVDFTIDKYGVISSFWNKLQKQKNFDQLLASRVAFDDLEKGLTVIKIQRKQVDGTVEYEEFEEFRIKVPPGSVLLFPSEKAVGIDAIDFDVKNLIVLDGTWAKAKRMYNENPWLKLLPHLKLDLDKLSLYSGVRRQPKVGCLSTIESIVYALKAFGEDSEKLDGLLEVFESMVGDQRRCKDERLNNVSVKPS